MAGTHRLFCFYLTGPQGNQNSPFCILLLAFGLCVASLALRWWNGTCVVKCEGEEMRRRDEKKRKKRKKRKFFL